MLLQALVDYANHYLGDSSDAFEDRTVRWLIPIDSQGNLRGDGVIDLGVTRLPRTKSSRKIRT